jgi:hypothetical protein
MLDLFNQPPIDPLTAARKRDLVFVYALLGSIVTYLLCGLSIRHDRFSPGGISIGWPLEVLLWMVLILVACFLYGLICEAMWQAMFGAALGTAVGLFCALVLVMASPSDDLPKDKMRLFLVFHNHTGEFITATSVADEGYEQVHAHSTAERGCCVVYPKVWDANAVTKVRWTTSSSDPKASGEAAIATPHEATVSFDRYAGSGDRTKLNVHFLSAGQVRLVISDKSASHPDYPGPSAPEKPADFPLQRD